MLPGNRNLIREILKRACIVVDEIEQSSQAGELNVPISRGEIRRKDIRAQLGEVIMGLKAGRQSPRTSPFLIRQVSRYKISPPERSFTGRLSRPE